MSQKTIPIKGLAALIFRLVEQGSGAAAAVFGDTKCGTLVELAAQLGVSYDTVRGWPAQGMPGSKGAYILADVVTWQLGKALAAAGAGGGKDDLDRKRDADARLSIANASRRERENRIADGDLISRADVERELGVMLNVTRMHFERIPHDLSPRIPLNAVAVVTAELTHIIRLKLWAMGKYRLSWEPTVEQVPNEISKDELADLALEKEKQCTSTKTSLRPKK